MLGPGTEDAAPQKSAANTTSQQCHTRTQRWKVSKLILISGVSVLALAVVVVNSVHLGSTIQIGPDEHFEVTKSFLWARGYPLYTRVWNDQLPLYTCLMGMLFKYLGSTIYVARCLALCFGILLMTGFFVLVKHRSGSLAACVATSCLVVAPQVFELSISAMLEVPAISVALWALWPVCQWVEKQGRHHLILSGLFLAAALQIKPTAAIMVPAIATEIALASKRNSSRESAKAVLSNLAVWSGVIIIGFLVLGKVLGSQYHELWNSHFSAQTVESKEAMAHVFSLRLIWNHTEAFWGAIAAVLIVALQRDWRRMAFPLVLLLTVLAVHLQHRPYWDYYYLHFAVPLAWLTGYAVTELFQFAWNKELGVLFGPPFTGIGALLGGSLLVSTVVAFGGARLASEIENIRDLPRVQDSALIAKMKQYASGTKWVYTRSTIYPFHAHLLVIPELAVLPAKRFWSGQITQPQILKILKHYRPEQLLFGDETLDPDTKLFIDTGYVQVYQDAEHRLYVAKRIAARSP